MSKPISPNTIIGQYSVVSKIGEGGMGEVYRARDTKLGRDVAIKVLPAAFSEDSEKLRRFEQEAQAAGALNHPNILVIFHIGTHDGAPYIVSELLEGETLRERMSGTALPQRKAIDYALQTAHGLAAAHAKGIVHRDLKPENLFVTNDGRAKILDFGLAKLVRPQFAGDVDTKAATLRANTDPGRILGTVGYMSPEQVRGELVDQRSDIFAFGAILYEMLSGRTAFHRQSTADTISAILKEDPPDLSTTKRNVTPALERIMRHCLEKKPEERFHSASDLAFALEALSASTATSTQTEAQPALERRGMNSRERLAWITAGILFLALLALLIFVIAPFRESPAESRAVRSFILPPENSSFDFTDTNAGSLSISPDGRRLTFVAPTAEGKDILWVRSLDALSAQALTGTEGASFPFWSPDSRFIGFFAGGKLKKIEAAGGPALTLCDAPEARGGAWNRDGVIVFAPDVAGALQQISASGGPPSAVTQLDQARAGTTHRWPYFLPDDQHFLYLSRGATASETQTGSIYVTSLGSKESKLLLRVSSNVAYAQGYLIFLRAGTLMAQAFDAKRLEMAGDAFPIALGVQSEPSMARAVFAVSENGVLAYQTGSVRNGSQLAWFDRNYKQLSVLGDVADYGSPQLSPDGKRLAVSIVDPQNGNQDIWLYDVARGLRTRFTVDPGDERSPAWSPDGSRIVFSSNRKGHFDLYQKSAGGVGNDEPLLESDLEKHPLSWSPDGRFLLYNTVDPKSKADLWVLPLGGDRKPFPFLQTEFNEFNGQFSPDGRWIAYVSDESGGNEIYVAPFPGPGPKQQISTSGGRQPKWQGDGKEIFYLAPGKKLMAAEVNGQGASLVIGAARPLFEVHPYESGYAYDVTTDGQRFLINTIVEQKASAPITLVLNWTADLKR